MGVSSRDEQGTRVPLVEGNTSVGGVVILFPVHVPGTRHDLGDKTNGSKFRSGRALDVMVLSRCKCVSIDCAIVFIGINGLSASGYGWSASTGFYSWGRSWLSIGMDLVQWGWCYVFVTPFLPSHLLFIVVI
uniref:Uncharacterized protein n=1 Tax=Lepeophtheirus salmonis TaxID=72036 RepID=A0A0K2TH52_LEPSM